MKSPRIHFTVVPAEGVATGVSAKTGRKIKLSEVTFVAGPKFFIDFASEMLGALEAAYEEHVRRYEAEQAAKKDEAPVQSDEETAKAAAELEEALVTKLREACRRLFGGPIATG